MLPFSKPQILPLSLKFTFTMRWAPFGFGDADFHSMKGRKAFSKSQ
jgi:hypothetical protein